MNTFNLLWHCSEEHYENCSKRGTDGMFNLSYFGNVLQNRLFERSKKWSCLTQAMFDKIFTDFKSYASFRFLLENFRWKPEQKQKQKQWGRSLRNDCSGYCLECDDSEISSKFVKNETDLHRSGGSHLEQPLRENVEETPRVQKVALGIRKQVNCLIVLGQQGDS